MNRTSEIGQEGSRESRGLSPSPDRQLTFQGIWRRLFSLFFLGGGVKGKVEIASERLRGSETREVEGAW